MSDAIRSITSVALILSVTHLFGQRLGLLPPSVEWYQLQHDSLNVIYPEGQEKTARRVASLMLKLAAADPIVINGRYKPVSVLLQPQTTISNGYVGLAPYVSEFYLEPHENPFELGSLPFEDLLALHEYRHVQQLNAANTGFSHLVKTIFGDLAFTGLYNLAVPDWYREGDAVHAETKWSLQGRGRLSQFVLPFYQKAIEGDPWDYYKVRNGSFREFTPDVYALGYMMIQYGHQHFGEATWDTIMRQAPRFENIIRPFSSEVKERYGKLNRGLYLDAMECYKDQCHTNRVPDVAYPPVTIAEKDEEADFVDFQYPAMDGDGSMYAAVTTFDRTTAICRIQQDGTRSKVVSTGLQKDVYFHYNNDRFVWTEIRIDPRWIRRDKSVIVVYDAKKKSKQSFIPDKGYFTPSLDPRGERIVVLHEDDAGQYTLRILSASTGELLQELPNRDNLYLGYPIFAADGKHIIATARDDRGQMCLIRQELASGNISQITHYSYSVLGKPVEHGPWIFLATGLRDVNQVFAVDQHEGIYYQISTGNSAHYDPVWDPVQDGIVCSEYRLNGRKLVRLSSQPHQWKLTNLDDGIKTYDNFSGRNLLGEPDRTDGFVVKKYSRWANALNYHSWIVTADDPVWGIEARSDNKLNTVSLAGGYQFNRSSRAKGPYLNAVFGMWFPQFHVGISNVSREVTEDDEDPYRAVSDQFTLGMSIPLQFTPGVYQQFASLAVSYNTAHRKNRPLVNAGSAYEYNYNRYQLILINSRRKAYRQPMPSFGQRLDVSFAHHWSGIPLRQFYMSAEVALPALSPSHYLMVRGERMSQDYNATILLSSPYAGPRGFGFMEGRSQSRIGVTYGLPLWYPDKGFGNIFYTRRIRLQGFFDYAMTSHHSIPDHGMKSAGAEIIFDFDFPPVALGVRYARIFDGITSGPNKFELFIPSVRF